MKIQIDQSGKVENTSHNTVVAFSNGTQHAILIEAKDKRLLQKAFRNSNNGRLYVYRTFAVLLFLLIRPYVDSITDIIIDIEYEGKDTIIYQILVELLNQHCCKVPCIVFRRIGNKPKVHYTAYNVFKGNVPPSRRVLYKEIEHLAIKKDRGHK